MWRFDAVVSKEREEWLGERLESDNTAASVAMAALRRTPAGQELPLQLYALGGQGVVAGGITGRTWGRWLHVELLWVDAGQRGRGLGAQLLRRAEDLARRERGCAHARVETWDFQAPGFYRRQGYAVVGEVAGCPPGVTEYLLAKKL
ncbi:GNAT family N-acetyltransferase [Streptomyces sp. HU2014]|uniref:GNAT family N-acetyltransferase n=1 Tax=Streptomyces sp. HU2014 TaxID=2939414 RepID=UPI00200E5D96|nr:GNAT family N-acetyltransferase [Streptomyces sp. HU2014]UQI46058.1 GNAT family N-acetyltransferase [Streptomyces sp. HU2014]